MDCAHLAAASTSADIQRGIKLARAWSSKSRARRRGGRADSLDLLPCKACAQTAARVFVCLACGTPLCGLGEREPHFGAHAQASSSELLHSFFYDPRTSSIYCAQCDDYISDDDAAPLPEPSGSFERAMPSVIGVPRGIRNLGQTCFMSVILQTFLHNPHLQRFFLSDGHNREICPHSTEVADDAASPPPKPCLCCELDRLFCDYYSRDEVGPIGPIHLVRAVWEVASDLAGDTQQDAHEFLMSALNLIHASLPGSTEASPCHCIIHKTFAGELQSEVRCGDCGNVNLSVDPLLDISLDIRAAYSLAECFKRFTSAENLTQQYTCDRCHSASPHATRQLSIKTLPRVMFVQLKRFEHIAASQKLESFVRFPLRLDMGDFVSSKGHAHESCEYTLSAVLCHEGKMETGHYTSFVRLGEDFWFVDDEKVAAARLADVLQAKAYILVYDQS